MRALRKLLKYLLPYGIVEAHIARKRFRGLGRNLRMRDLWRSDWLLHHSDETGLSMFPPGQLRDVDCVVDVGANVGQWSAMLLDCITPRRLIIVEPLPSAFAQLKERFRGNPRVQLHCVAIGKEIGLIKFQVARDTTGASALRPREEMRSLIGSNWTVESEIDVSVTTLDALLDEVAEITLLKIDVQGFEKSVFAGALRTLEKTKFVLVELNYMPQYVDGSTFAEVHEILTRDDRFYLANTTKPLCLNGRASMCNGLYVNAALVPDFVKPDFV